MNKGGTASCVADSGVLGGELYGVVATDTGFVAVGGQAQASDPTGGYRRLVLASSDGRNWAPDDLSVEARGVSNGFLSDVAFGNGTIVAVGPGGGSNSKILTKAQGGPWQVKSMGTNNEKAFFGNGVFLVTASVEPGAVVSSDGINWTGAGISGVWFGFVDGSFIAYNLFNSGGSATNGVRTSTDGATWSSTMPLPPSFLGVEALALVGSELLGFGVGPCDGSSCPPIMLSGPRGTPIPDLSVQPVPWTTSAGTLAKAIAASPTRVVVIATSMTYSTPLPLGTEGWSSVGLAWQASDIAYSGGTFVVVGARDGHAVAATSTDGLAWVEQDVTQRAP